MLESQLPSKIRVVISDHEPLARKRIRQLIMRETDFAVIAETRNGPETVTILRQLNPDAVFLNVQLPLMDGFDVLRKIGDDNAPAIIFMTASPHFAVRAFEVQALDYLVKPVTERRFLQAIERLRKCIEYKKAEDRSRQLTAILSAEKDSGRKQRVLVPLPSGDNLFLDADEIHWIQAESYYAAIHARGRRHLIRESLTSLEGRLDGRRFVRAHRSAIVNIDHVQKLRKGTGEAFLVLCGGVDIPVSRRRREQVLRVLRQQAV